MKTRVVIWGSIAVLVFSWFLWILFPREKNPAKMNSHVRAAKERFTKVQSVANDPSQNGWQSETFLPYWGRKDKEYQEDSPVGKTVRTWVGEYSTTGKGETVNHKALLQAEDAAYLKALRSFEKLVPELQAAMEKPVFVEPQESALWSNTVMNYIAARGAAQGMAGYAEYAVAEGRPAVAADVLSAAAQMGQRLGSNGVLITQMIGLAVQAIARDEICRLLPPRADLKAKEWTRLSNRLFEAVMDKDQLFFALENEVMTMENSLRQIHLGVDGAEGILEGSAYLSLPGILSKEERIYRNVMGKMLDALQREENTIIPAAAMNPSMVDCLAGRTGALVALAVPNTIRARSQVELNDRAMISTALYAGLMAYRQKKGTMPDKLEKLSAVGVKVPESVKSRLKLIDYKVSSGQRASLSFEFNDGIRPSAETLAESGKWISVAGERVTFKL